MVLTKTVTWLGSYIIEKYTGDGTITWTHPFNVGKVEYLVVAGGGGNGGTGDTSAGGAGTNGLGGGGAGGSSGGGAGGIGGSGVVIVKYLNQTRSGYSLGSGSMMWL